MTEIKPPFRVLLPDLRKQPAHRTFAPQALVVLTPGQPPLPAINSQKDCAGQQTAGTKSADEVSHLKPPWPTCKQRETRALNQRTSRGFALLRRRVIGPAQIFSKRFSCDVGHGEVSLISNPLQFALHTSLDTHLYSLPKRLVAH